MFMRARTLPAGLCGWVETKKDEDVLEKKVDKILKLLKKSQVQEVDHLAARDRQGPPQISVPQLQDAHAQLSSKSLPARVPSTADSPDQIANRSLARARQAPHGRHSPGAVRDSMLNARAW